ncbi:nitroreductase family protein [uncultured Holdemanella sp.]|uniref:nitroreductase family protein n=1 Tax=uncultured Holdemanella sp. TaxID=1763549 RepID=UPI0025847598|nr:nitroreductase family protein [uncultured Holdemanella sp.]
MIEKRHTVRKYLNQPLNMDLVDLLNDRIKQNNELYDLTLKLVMNNSDGISSLARLMSNNTVQNYIILAGKECSSLDEKIGYCGADLILYAQSLGLNTWWCGGMFNGKNALKHLDDKDVRVNGVIAIGYGKTQGVPHKSKTADQISHYQGVVPDWFNAGIKALLLAPSALNRQPYIVSGVGNKVSFKVKKWNFIKSRFRNRKIFF